MGVGGGWGQFSGANLYLHFVKAQQPGNVIFGDSCYNDSESLLGSLFTHTHTHTHTYTHKTKNSKKSIPTHWCFQAISGRIKITTAEWTTRHSAECEKKEVERGKHTECIIVLKHTQIQKPCVIFASSVYLQHAVKLVPNGAKLATGNSRRGDHRYPFIVAPFVRQKQFASLSSYFSYFLVFFVFLFFVF